MKKEWIQALIFWGISLLFLAILIPIAGADNLTGSVIRFHVIANSDSEEDQSLKLLVRDRLLDYAKTNFSTIGEIENAKFEIENRLGDLEREAKDVLEENGCFLPVSVALKEEYYPTKEYENLSFPNGTYLSLQVRIGRAQGKNWWCVFFPPMCFNSALNTEDALLEAGMEKENVKTVTRSGGEYKIRFKIVEIWEKTKTSLKAFF